jgi:GAF domain-containing protein
MFRSTGVCGTAAAKAQTVIVDDVSKIDNYIACDAETQSEIVVPVLNCDGSVHSVLDIDSEVVAAFDEVDREQLELIVARFVLQVKQQASAGTD